MVPCEEENKTDAQRHLRSIILWGPGMQIMPHSLHAAQGLPWRARLANEIKEEKIRERIEIGIVVGNWIFRRAF